MKLRNKINPLLLILPLLLISGCEERIDWLLKPDYQSVLVVDGMITSEARQHTIRLTTSYTQLNSEPGKASGAQVIISDKDSSWTLTEFPVNSGLYRTKPFFAAKLNVQYTLFISYQSQVYSAKATMVKGNPLVPVHYQKKNNGLFQINWIANPYNPRKPAMFTIFLDWSGVPGYSDIPPDSCRALIKAYSLPTLDVSEVLAPEAEKVFFPAGTVITELKYSLSDEYAAFLRAMLLETSWSGGFFDTAPANLPTNLSGGALGFFAVCEEHSVRIIVKP